VRAPTQLIVGSLDTEVIALNRQAMRHLDCPHELVIVPGAGHLFEEPGTLDAVIGHARRWFAAHLD
jgi:pimeloyl-ACP methyl ester carboxylesterase